MKVKMLTLDWQNFLFENMYTNCTLVLHNKYLIENENLREKQIF